MSKLNAKSNSLRLEGNKLFNQRSYYNAMIKYNESLCFAESNSEMMGLAYANRSAIYFEMKLFENCLRNIDLAERNHYPEANIEVLNKRKEKCLMALKQSTRENSTSDMQQFFKLSYQSNKKLPFMVDCLELKDDNKYGRHIITNKSLKVGDVVAIEKPFCKIVQNEFIQQLCSWCFNSNLSDLIPCRICTKAMFCSDECQTKAYRSFHKYECPVNEVASTLSPNVRMTLRKFFLTLTMFDESLDDLQKYLLEHPDPCTVFDVEHLDERAKFLATNSLIANHEISIDRDIFEKIFQISPELNEMWSKHGDFIANFLQRQIQIAALNFYEIFFWPLKKGRLQDQDKLAGSLAYQRGTVAAGSASYLLCSLLNHSCAPNVMFTFISDTIVLVVQRPIQRGDQLFSNYGHHFTNVSKDCRQMELLKHYKFKCDCEACANNWPLLPDLKVGDRMCLNKAKKICRELNLNDLTRKKAFVKYRELCEIVEKNGKNFPSLETCSISQSAAAYLEMSLKPPLQFP